MWHDHATILRNGFIMVTLHIVYDAAVFFTNKEYFNKTCKRLNVQCEVEQPEIYRLDLGSSSVEDQAAVIPDQAECFSDLSTPVVTTNGKLVTIVLWPRAYRPPKGRRGHASRIGPLYTAKFKRGSGIYYI